MEKITPYNTGKVKIGAHYNPRNMQFSDEGASDFIHDLLFPHTAQRTNRIMLFKVGIGLVAFIVLYAYMFFWRR